MQQMNIDLEKSARAMMASGSFHHHAGGRNPVGAALKPGNMTCDGLPHGFERLHSLKIDFHGCLHGSLHRLLSGDFAINIRVTTVVAALLLHTQPQCVGRSITSSDR